MKKVRFLTPDKRLQFNRMEERECHSPRPFTERQIYTNVQEIYSCPKVLPYSNDPVQLFESSNSSPYPTMNKTAITDNNGPQWSPSNDLELSMLDSGHHEPRKPTFRRHNIMAPIEDENNFVDTNSTRSATQNPILTSVENKTLKPPNVLVKDNDFFIKRDNLGKIQFDNNFMQQEFNNLSLDKENNPLVIKAQLFQTDLSPQENRNSCQLPAANIYKDCMCHHCVKNITPTVQNMRPQAGNQYNQHVNIQRPHYVPQNAPHQNHCMCSHPPVPSTCACCNPTPQPQQCKCKSHETPSPVPKMNAVDKKTWAIEKYEQGKKSDSMEVEKQTNVVKEKREPTVADLFKIIKLQNEQLQLLQEKVDKFISASQQNHAPVQNHMTEHVAIETIGEEQHKISIGVMTSFEMVRTSTIINKEVLKTSENAQVQCNKSQISIKEVVSKTQSPNLNFLDGITRMGNSKNVHEVQHNMQTSTVGIQNEEKTLNEMSLYNVQVDNATTPLMSPDQSLYLDVRDYSDSDAENDDQSNVGWTYYNKVMTHVNGMLQDSDMPSSASALYRNARQQMQTVQMHIDKTNVSVTKRVKFGDDPLGLRQPHIYAASTDTSLKMNQLAAKYLKGGVPAHAPQRAIARPNTAPIDMSFATRNYMERHKLLQGAPDSSKSPSPTAMPRFLDITALKQQPKFL